MALGQHASEFVVIQNASGWWLGLGIGLSVVFLVVVLVITILVYAGRIAEQASEGIKGMDAARSNTLAVWRVQDVNVAATGIWRAAQAASAHLSKGGT